MEWWCPCPFKSQAFFSCFIVLCPFQQSSKSWCSWYVFNLAFIWILIPCWSVCALKLTNTVFLFFCSDNSWSRWIWLWMQILNTSVVLAHSDVLFTAYAYFIIIIIISSSSIFPLGALIKVSFLENNVCLPCYKLIYMWSHLYIYFLTYECEHM